MNKYIVPLLFASSTAFAQGLPVPQTPPLPSQAELIDSYIKALEQQLAFKNQQEAFMEGKVREWIEYSKPLWAPPVPQAEAK